MSTSANSKPASWFSHLPTPSSSATPISVKDLHALYSDPTSKAGVDYLVVDVRRADIDDPESNHLIPAAINLPAQTFHQTLPVLLPLLSRIPKVIFHCSSSNGRGPRCAGWYQDALNSAISGTATEVQGGAGSRAFVLTGGLKAWLKDYPEETVRL